MSQNINTSVAVDETFKVNGTGCKVNSRDAKITAAFYSNEEFKMVELGASPLTRDEVVAVARRGTKICLSSQACSRIEDGREIIITLANDTKPHYGVSTGFGALATVQIPIEKRAQLQRSLVRSHAAGSGEEVQREVIRALMLLRLNTLCSGRTGVTLKTAQVYAQLLNAGITPVVYEYGSLGCSGDLSPLAHCALAVMGEGEVRDANGNRRPSAEVLAEAGIEPTVLTDKEGLALINGTDGMLGMLILALHDLEGLFRMADVAAAASVEALLGTDSVFAAELHLMRPHPGQIASAANIAKLLSDSELVCRATTCRRVQDAYSLRCSPQVHGAARDTFSHAVRVAEVELMSVIDNPVITANGDLRSNGNFHGAPLAYVLDFLAIALADVASISERRTDRFLDTTRSHGLPPFLAADPGVDSGLMIAQYTAAGIVSHLKRLATPASVDSIPSSAMQEDHVSMGWGAGCKLQKGVEGLSQVLAIELLVSTRALDFHERANQNRPGAAMSALHKLFHERIPGPENDSFLSPQIRAVHEFVRSGQALSAVEAAIGALM